MRLKDRSRYARHARIVIARQWLERMHAEATSERLSLAKHGVNVRKGDDPEAAAA